MIYTITCNPSLDYLVSLQKFEIGKTNRTKDEQIVVGGKGINVSIVLRNLGIQSTALGFIAGFTGNEILKQTKNLGIHCQFIKVEDGFSRINIKLKDYDGTEINGLGPVIKQEHVNQLKAELGTLKEHDVLVLAGSIVSGLDETFYEDLMKEVQKLGVLVVVDATKDLLLNTLSYRPFLIKPNHHELGDFFQTELHTKEEVIPYAKKLQNLGARNILVSMGEKGAVLLAENGEIYLSDAPKGKLVHAVGSGDSMVAGFLAGWMEKKEYEHAFYMGVASGSASAFSETLATKEEIFKIYHQLSRGR